VNLKGLGCEMDLPGSG